MLLGLGFVGGFVALAFFWPLLWIFGVFRTPAPVAHVLADISSLFSSHPTIKGQS
jgi:hypothetical protein